MALASKTKFSISLNISRNVVRSGPGSIFATLFAMLAQPPMHFKIHGNLVLPPYPWTVVPQEATIESSPFFNLAIGQ